MDAKAARQWAVDVNAQTVWNFFYGVLFFVDFSPIHDTDRVTSPGEWFAELVDWEDWQNPPTEITLAELETEAVRVYGKALKAEDARSSPHPPSRRKNRPANAA